MRIGVLGLHTFYSCTFAGVRVMAIEARVT
jgi:hypothetical protein